MGEKQKSVSRDRVAWAPLVVELMRKEMFQADKNGNQIEHAKEEVTVEIGESATSE